MAQGLPEIGTSSGHRSPRPASRSATDFDRSANLDWRSTPERLMMPTGTPGPWCESRGRRGTFPLEVSMKLAVGALVVLLGFAAGPGLRSLPVAAADPVFEGPVPRATCGTGSLP